MEWVDRRLRIELPPRQSAFLWGPRKTGKSAFLRRAFPGSVHLDLLRSDLRLDLLRRPALLRERLLAEKPGRLEEPVIIDEIQKVPDLMDEVHALIEDPGLRFILCGSSARKLRRGQANLLGGRAWRFEMFPLTTAELPDLHLLTALNHGLLPAHYFSADRRRSLAAYLRDYLEEEVFAEGLVRNLPAFSRFFDAAAFSNGELLNCAAVARDCGVDAKTVRAHFQILVDTLLGVLIEPFAPRRGRDVITRAPKFYFFDVGIAGALLRRTIEEERGEAFGRAFEHFILMEILAHRSLSGLGYEVGFWRTKSRLEVDFVLGGGEVAVEVKGSDRVDRTELRGLRTFVEEQRPGKAIVVCNEPVPRRQEGIDLLPWREFLRRLWAGEVLA